MKYLFIVPHGDDEVLGFGGTIAKLVEERHEVGVVILQASNNERTAIQLKDTNKAKKILGYSALYNLYITDEEFCGNIYSVIQKLEALLQKIKPEIVYTTYISDNHQDHNNLYKAVAVASRPIGFVPSLKAVYIGEVISSFDQSLGVERVKFIPNVYEELTEKQLNKKITALLAYSKEKRKFPHPRSAESIKAKAISRGIECGCRYAESFMLLREIKNV